ncbi:MAG: DUF3822 family protein [Bacteroidota bacterium]|nr:DUF3822 family protein [Bacteroidota bacterium]
MKDFEFVDAHFDVKYSSTYYLSIQLALDGFSFSVLDLLSNKYILLKNKALDQDTESLPLDYYCQYVYDFLINEKLFKYPFKGIGIIYISANSTFVPTTVFIKDRLVQLFEANFGRIKNIDILSNKLKNYDSINIFAIPDCLLRILSRQFKNFRIFHQATPLTIEAVSSSKNHKRPLKIHLNLNKNICDLVLVNAGQLIMFNSYKYNSLNDILYFLVNASEQIQQKGQVDELVLSGKINAYSDLEEQIKRYFKKVSHAQLNVQYSFSDSFGEFLTHEYSLLFNLYLCE